MAFDRMAFEPREGLRNSEYYPTAPESEADAREQVQGVSDQIKEFLNETLLPQVENAAAGCSGAQKIGSEEIQGVDGTNVFAQIVSLKTQIDDVSAGSVSDGSITTQKIAEAAVTKAKVANNAIGEAQLAPSAVTQEKICNGAVSGTKIAESAVAGNHIMPAAVSGAHIADGAIGNTKIAAGAVSATKIADGCVTKSKLSQAALGWSLVLEEGLNSGNGSIDMPSQAGKSEMMIQLKSADGIVAYGESVAPLNAEGRTIPYMHNISTFNPGNFSVDYRTITVGAVQISYTSSRAETVGGSTNLKRISVFTR